MLYKIIDLKAVEKTGAVYVLVHFWEGRQQMRGSPTLINDFYMTLRDQDVLVVVDDEGYATTESGRRVRMSSANFIESPDDPLVRETVKRDVPAQMRENIEAYWQRASGEKGDKTWPIQTRPKLTATDPAGVLDRDDVKALKGQEFEEADVHP